jgi:DNA-binding XRE family transcriptional regulator
MDRASALRAEGCWFESSLGSAAVLGRPVSAGRPLFLRYIAALAPSNLTVRGRPGSGWRCRPSARTCAWFPAPRAGRALHDLQAPRAAASRFEEFQEQREDGPDRQVDVRLPHRFHGDLAGRTPCLSRTSWGIRLHVAILKQVGTYSPWPYKHLPDDDKRFQVLLGRRVGKPDKKWQTRVRREFGDRLREIRLAAKMSQEKLALECGLDRSYVGQVERGERNLSLENIHKLATALGIEPWHLLFPSTRS